MPKRIAQSLEISILNISNSQLTSSMSNRQSLKIGKIKERNLPLECPNCSHELILSGYTNPLNVVKSRTWHYCTKCRFTRKVNDFKKSLFCVQINIHFHKQNNGMCHLIVYDFYTLDTNQPTCTILAKFVFNNKQKRQIFFKKNQ